MAKETFDLLVKKLVRQLQSADDEGWDSPYCYGDWVSYCSVWFGGVNRDLRAVWQAAEREVSARR